MIRSGQNFAHDFVLRIKMTATFIFSQDLKYESINHIAADCFTAKWYVLIYNQSYYVPDAPTF